MMTKQVLQCVGSGCASNVTKWSDGGSSSTAAVEGNTELIETASLQQEARGTGAG